jgi:hypothetical protein
MKLLQKRQGPVSISDKTISPENQKEKKTIQVKDHSPPHADFLSGLTRVSHTLKLIHIFDFVIQ